MNPNLYGKSILVIVRSDSTDEITRQKLLFFNISEEVSASSHFIDISHLSHRDAIDEITETANHFHISVVAVERLSILADSIAKARMVASGLIKSDLKLFAVSNSDRRLLEIHLNDLD
jgi:hypothetical protein